MIELKNKLIMGATGLVLAVTLSFSFMQDNNFMESESKLAHAEDKQQEDSKEKPANEQGNGKADNTQESANKGTNGICTNGERDVPYGSANYKFEWDKNWNGYSCDAADISGSRKIVKPISQSISEGENRQNQIYTENFLIQKATMVKVPAYTNEYLVSSHLKKEKKQINVGEAVPLNTEEPSMYEELEGPIMFEDIEAVENTGRIDQVEQKPNNE